MVEWGYNRAARDKPWWSPSPGAPPVYASMSVLRVCYGLPGGLDTGASLWFNGGMDTNTELETEIMPQTRPPLECIVLARFDILGQRAYTVVESDANNGPVWVGLYDRDGLRASLPAEVRADGSSEAYTRSVRAILVMAAEAYAADMDTIF